MRNGFFNEIFDQFLEAFGFSQRTHFWHEAISSKWWKDFCPEQMDFSQNLPSDPRLLFLLHVQTYFGSGSKQNVSNFLAVLLILLNCLEMLNRKLLYSTGSTVFWSRYLKYILKLMLGSNFFSKVLSKVLNLRVNLFV